MKVLYAIQGTGNGHVARAREIVPVLQQLCQPDLLLSGIQAEIELPFDIKYRYKGLSFIFGKKGGVDIWETYRRNKIFRLGKEWKDFPAEKYDLIINDFEPISAWAARSKNVHCVSLSHQCAVLAQEAPRPKHFDPMGWAILNSYAPSDRQYGFHFERYAPNIYTPVIRSEIRQLAPENKGHYTVYLPSYHDPLLIEHLSQFKEAKWEVFSKHSLRGYVQGNVHIFPINNQAFIDSMAQSAGVLCGAGFETPAEALFLGKKLMAIPMKAQYEQHCNAAGLANMGVPIIPELSPKYYPAIRSWLNDARLVEVNYPNEVRAILEKVLTDAERHLL